MRWKVLSMADITACPQVLDLLAATAAVTPHEADADALRQLLPNFDAYLASLHVRLDKESLAAATQLRVIATPSTGLDHIDIDYAEARGIEIISLKDDIAFLDSITATAEMAWCLLLATVRRLPWSFASACAGEWARDAFRGHQISGKTLGILGYGRLGRMVAEYGKAFRMNVIACDNKPVAAAPGVSMVDFATLLRESDVLSVHIHLNESNRGLIGEEALRAMKPGAVLINTSRGAIVDETALFAALNSGHLGGAGLDVIDGEWNADLKSHPLIRYANGHQNLVISPHTGGVTYESQAAAYTRTVEKLRDFLEAQA